MSPSARCHVRTSEVPIYHPANHSSTSNQRLIGRANVGAERMEVVLGTLRGGGGALPHAHPGLEQACYLVEGTAHVTVGTTSFDMVAGEMCFFPPGVMHVFTATSDVPVKVLAIYSPPYEESAERTVRLPSS